MKIFWLLFLSFLNLTNLCLAGATMLPNFLRTGDKVYIKDDTLVVKFKGPRKVLSSSLVGGGYQENLQGILNHHSQDHESMTYEDYKNNMTRLVENLGYDSRRFCTLGTGVPMKNAVYAQAHYQKFYVETLVTAGVEGNPGRVGDRANFDGFSSKDKQPATGTINIILAFNADAPGGVLARSIVTASEAKAAALQELAIGSRYSHGLATGTGTDQIAVIAAADGNFLLTDAGKHTKPGELIGTVVKEAVKAAIQKHNGIDARYQHSFLQRSYRFGINEKSLYASNNCGLNSSEFHHRLQLLDHDEELVTGFSLYYHLLDQLDWNLLSVPETQAFAQVLLQKIANKYQVQTPVLSIGTYPELLKADQDLIISIIKNKTGK
jgi:adenosylcobinamide hydrolase